jgi:hypothetical protein
MGEATNYTEIINRLRQDAEAARLNVALTVNKQMLVLYWRIGKIILEQQERQGWVLKL